MDLFKQFWDNGKYSEQQNFLIRLLECDKINRRHGTYNTPDLSRRQHTFRHFLLLPGNSKVEVYLLQVAPHRFLRLYSLIFM